MPLDKSMFETNSAVPMGLGDFEARQRAQKQQDRRRKSDCTEMMRRTQYGGLDQTDIKMASMKKEARKSQADAAKYMHENLSKASQGLDSQFLKEKAQKEEDRQKQQAASEINRGYKGGVKEEDLVLAQIKREAREKKQEAAHFNHESLSKSSQALDSHFLKEKAMKEDDKLKKIAADEFQRSYKGGVSGDDLILAEIKKEERQKKIAASEINRGYKGGVKEEDLKLAGIKKEDRQKKQAASELNRGYKGGVKEDDLRLSEIKKEGRQKKIDAAEINHSYGGIKHTASPMVEATLQVEAH